MKNELQEWEIPNWEQYTNAPELWYENNLHELNCSLWVTYHNPTFVPMTFQNMNKQYNVDESVMVDINYIRRTDSWNKSKYIFIVGQESFCRNWTKYKDNIYVIDSTFMPYNTRFVPFFWWFGFVVDIEQNLLFCDKLVSNTDKQKNKNIKVFDCLMGRPRPHRQFISDIINANKLLQLSGIYSQFRGNQEFHLRGTDLAQEKKGAFAEIYTNDGMFVYDKEKGSTCRVPLAVPYLIYNESYYTIVAETRNDHVFLTEKTAKPIIAERLFIMIGAQHTLKHMQAHGFKTFGSVIDESYDDEPDDEKRWSMAMEQVEFLCTADHCDVLTKIQSIVEHNRKFLINKCSWDSLNDSIAEIINQ
jgi:hypothetical protein